MNFLQKIISKGILKSLEKLSKTDPVIRGKWEELGKISNDLAIAIEKNKKDRRGD